MIPFDDLYLFTTIAEQGSFAAAAKKLSMPASTLSRRISALEQRLNCKLIERTTRQLSLTKSGRELFVRITPSFASINFELTGLNQRQEAESGKIRITCPVFLGQTLITDWLLEFQQIYPSIELEFILSNAMEDMIEKNIDLALRFGPLPDSQLISQYLMSTQLSAVASLNYLDSVSDTLTLEQASQHARWLSLDWYGETVNYQSPNDSGHLSFKPYVSSNDISVIKRFTLAGRGIGLLPEVSVQHELANKKLVKPWPKTRFGKAKSIYLVYPNRDFLPKKSKLLIDFLKSKPQSVGLGSDNIRKLR